MPKRRCSQLQNFLNDNLLMVGSFSPTNARTYLATGAKSTTNDRLIVNRSHAKRFRVYRKGIYLWKLQKKQFWTSRQTSQS